MPMERRQRRRRTAAVIGGAAVVAHGHNRRGDSEECASRGEITRIGREGAGHDPPTSPPANEANPLT